MFLFISEILFPVLDITRLAVRNKEINGIIFDTTHGPEFIKYLLSLLSAGKINLLNFLSKEPLAKKNIIKYIKQLAILF